ncbi:Uncharacterised protein [uncultured archaeon]|nr:Uncharacterised protein [uncultured archaeon]
MIKGKDWSMEHEPFDGREVDDPDLYPICNRKIEYDTVIMHLVPEYYPYWIKRESGKRMVGYVVWETDKIPKHWPKLLNMPDILLVPTEWNKNVFKNWGVTKPIYVIPHIIRSSEPLNFDFNNFCDNIHKADYVFYTIGDWTVRKSIGKTIQCYLENFSADDEVVLLIKTSPRDFTRKIINRFLYHTENTVREILRNYRNPARVRLITDEISDQDILRLHSLGNCYISLCRSEGWGLGAFDAAGFGKPVIITGYGGPTEYLPRELAYLVDCHQSPVIDNTCKSYSKDQNWAEPELAHASQLIRAVFEHRDEADEKGKLLAQYIQRNFNETLIIEKLVKSLNES